MSRPIIICIDGLDGSGKQTQCQLIKERLSGLGYKVESISFPQYDNESSIFVKKYLAGEYGANALDVNPYTSSMFFIMDRMISYANSWRKIIESEDVQFVILDRYVSSNILHQGSKIMSNMELIDYIHWEEDLEFNKLKLPKPDVTYFLSMPLWASKLLRKDRANKITGEDKQDIHESDDAYMSQVQTKSAIICKKMKWVPISCVSPAVGKGIGDRGDILSINAVNDLLLSDICTRFEI